MVCIGSKLLSMDNSGVKLGKCIKVYGSVYAKPASVVKIALRRISIGRKLKKGGLLRAVMVRLRKPFIRLSGFSLKFFDNLLVVLKKNESVPIGTRIDGTVYLEIRFFGYIRIVALCRTVV